jgi:hypothetical protein
MAAAAPATPYVMPSYQMPARTESSLVPGVVLVMIGFFAKGAAYLYQAFGTSTYQVNEQKILNVIWAVSSILIAVGVLVGGIALNSRRAR